MGYLFLVLVSPLAGYLDSNPPVFVDVPDTGLRLEESVFLMGEFVCALDDHIRRSPTRFHITLADLEMLANIAPNLRVKDYFFPSRFKVSIWLFSSVLETSASS